MFFLLRWILSAVTLLFVGSVIPGIRIQSFYAALIVIIVLGLVNAVIRPLLIILTLPINILTLGLFTFVINGFLFWLVSSFVKGFDVAGFAPAFFGALLFSVISWIISQLLK